MSTKDKERTELIDQVTVELAELRQAADRLDEAAAALFSLNRTDLRCLGILYRRGRVTAGELAEESGLTPGAITTVLDRLEKGGYANRVADPEDRRRVLVISTVATRDVGARIYGEVEVSGHKLLEPRAAEELTAIRDYLRGMRAIYENQAGHAVCETATLDGAASAAGKPEVAAPLGAAVAARLEFNKGASMLSIRGDSDLGELYHARFEGPVPDVFQHGSTVTIKHTMRSWPFDWGARTADVTLYAGVPWAISLRGGIWKLSADLRNVRLESLEVAGGASDIEVWLPAAHGTVLVRVSGGASKVALHRPADVPVRADVSGGANQLVFDGQRLGGIGGSNRLESPGYEESTDRYDVRFSGGASQVTIDVV